MQDQNEKDSKPSSNNSQQKGGAQKQEQSDPQLTELRGFVDPKEDLEPTLSDGKKSPDKAGEEKDTSTDD
jgi:hypothetical protein